MKMLLKDKFVLIDIGCIECGESSTFLGVYDTLDEAKAARDEYITNEPNEYGRKWGRKEWMGQHSVDIFDGETGEEIYE